MPASFPSDQEVAKPSLHPALYGMEGLPASVPTILVCPLPLSGFPHEQLLPELSHELKTPLAGIMGLAQVLQRDTNAVAAREHQYADLIYQRSQQLLVSINDLFDLAQLCTHQFVLQLRPIDLSSVVKTALKVAQYTTPSDLPSLNSDHASSETPELWMMGDLPRVEQLLTHLIGYFAAQGLPHSHPLITLKSHHSWLSITLTGKLQLESPLGQGLFSTPYPTLNVSVSHLPGRGGTVLKFLLAQQLAQLHGGDVSWRIKASLETEVTVLLPRDLTRATFFKRSGPAQPLFLLYAPHFAEVDHLAQTLNDQAVLAVVARSLHETQEKTRILSPSVLVLDSDCVKTPEWPALETLLTEPLTFPLIQVVWLKTRPASKNNEQMRVLDVWSIPIMAERVSETLHKLQQQITSLPAQFQASLVSLAAQSHHRPLIVLQIAQISLSPPETIFVAIMTHLSRDFDCSVLVVDDLAQAQLLAEIWQPQVMVCSGASPQWAIDFSESSALAQLPLFLLDIEGHKVPQCYSSNHCHIYAVARDASIQHAAQDLYKTLSAAAQGDFENMRLGGLGV
jgi:hypothetical protein